MVKKRGKKGKYLFLHGACLLVILLLNAGCVTNLNFQKRWQGHKHLDQAEKLISKGDYKGALKEHEEVLRLFPGVSPGDRALFHMGLIWAHPDNPQRNYNKALECLQRLVGDFPRSALREEARVLVGTIGELIWCEGKIKDLEETVNALKKQLNAKTKDLEETVNALKKQLNALKEIDLGIEEKKREDLPRK
jgi:tetratricopeptide (TPR) repeat protein